jgi:hypothetical protein
VRGKFIYIEGPQVLTALLMKRDITVYTVKGQQMFWRNMLLPSSCQRISQARNQHEVFHMLHA